MVYLIFNKLSDSDPVSLMTALIRSLMQIAVCLPIIWVLNKYLPFVVGREKVKAASCARGRGVFLSGIFQNQKHPSSKKAELLDASVASNGKGRAE